jgi:hypothetical protein
MGSRNPLTTIIVNMTKEYYGKQESKIMAAIAVILLLCHHFLGFPGWRAEGNSVLNILGNQDIIERSLGSYGFICIAIFAFSSGYVLYRRSDEYHYGRRLLIRLISFLLGYWICLALLYIVGALCGSPLPKCHDLLLNLIGISCRPGNEWVNIPFAWYVLYYIIYLAVTPPINTFIINTLHDYRRRNLCNIAMDF